MFSAIQLHRPLSRPNQGYRLILTAGLALALHVCGGVLQARAQDSPEMLGPSVAASVHPYSMMACAAYGDCSKGDPGSAGYTKESMDWKTVMRRSGAGERVISMYEKAGFSATVYRSDKTKEIVIAFRGTDDKVLPGLIKPMASLKPGDWETNRDALSLKTSSDRLVAQYVGARSMAARIGGVYASTPYKEYKIVLTGHSLGGGLASYAGQHLKSANVYTFDAARNALVGGTENPRQINIIARGDPVSDPRVLGRIAGKTDMLPGKTYVADKLPGMFIAKHDIGALTTRIGTIASSKPLTPGGSVTPTSFSVGGGRVGGILLNKAAAEKMPIDIDIQAVQIADGHIVLSGTQSKKTRLDAALFATTLRMACEPGYDARFSLDPDQPAAWLDQGQRGMKALAEKIGEGINWKQRRNIKDGLTVETYSLKKDFPELWSKLAPSSQAMRSKLVFGPLWLADTRVGEILYKADVLLKDLTSGVSFTRPGQPSRTAQIPGYVSGLNRRAAFGLINDPESPKAERESLGHRMWFSLMPTEGGRTGVAETFDNPLTRLTTANDRLRAALLNERYVGRNSYRPVMSPAFYVSNGVTDVSQVYPKMFMRVHDVVKRVDVEGSDPHQNVIIWDVNQEPERYMAVFEELRDLADVFRAYVASVKIVQKDRAVCDALQRLPLQASEKVASPLPAFHPSEVLATAAIWVESKGGKREMRVSFAMSHDGGISMHGTQFASQAEIKEETRVIRETRAGLNDGIKGPTWKSEAGRHFVALKISMVEEGGSGAVTPAVKRDGEVACTGLGQNVCASQGCLWVDAYVNRGGLPIPAFCRRRDP